jgi:hypothetical protein
MKRRLVLGTVAGTLLPLGGCLSELGLRSEDAGVVLTRISIENDSKSSHTVTVNVLYDGEIGHSKEYEVGPREGDVLGGQVINADPPDKPGEVVVRAETADQREEIDLTDRYGEACAIVQVWIESNGELMILTGNEGTECFRR